MKALAHVNVLDLTGALGALAGRMLSDLGAGVVKIDSPTEQAEDARGGLVWNLGKRRSTLDFRQPEGRQAFLGLVAGADVLIRNSVSQPFDHATLANINERLIDIVIVPFSSTGGLRERPATDLTLLARSGLMAIGGDPDRAPLKLPGEQAYALAGIQGAIAALTALYARGASGRGQLVEVSAYRSTVLANYREPVMWEWTGRIGARTGNLLVRGKSGVRQIWPCRNGYVTWTLVDNPSMMRAMTGALAAEGRNSSLKEVDWNKTLVADAPREQLLEWEQQIADFFAQHTKEELQQLSSSLGLGLSQVDDLDAVLDSAHLQHRKLWRAALDPVRGIDVQLPGPLFASSEDD